MVCCPQVFHDFSMFFIFFYMFHEFFHMFSIFSMIFQPTLSHQLGPPNAIALLRKPRHHRAVAIIALQHATEGASARLLGKPKVKNMSLGKFGFPYIVKYIYIYIYIYKIYTTICNRQYWSCICIGGLEHFLFFHILGIIIPTDELIFFRGLETTYNWGAPWKVRFEKISYFRIFQWGWNHQPDIYRDIMMIYNLNRKNLGESFPLFIWENDL